MLKLSKLMGALILAGFLQVAQDVFTGGGGGGCRQHLVFSI